MGLIDAGASRANDDSIGAIMDGGFSSIDLALDEISRYFDDCERWGRGSWSRALSQVSRERDELPDLYDAMIALGSARGWI